jgi:hypothetical protein
MRNTETMASDAREAADSLQATAAAKAAAARATLDQMAKRAREFASRAQDLAARAPERARSEISQRRTAAAESLESLAEALRPTEVARARARRNTVMVAGGSTLAIIAALGAGVALGFLLSRRRHEREARRAARLSPQTTTAPAPQDHPAYGGVSSVAH